MQYVRSYEHVQYVYKVIVVFAYMYGSIIYHVTLNSVICTLMLLIYA